ncbi:glycosyltransferase family 2 protein [Candidatus Saccharibacteria bacterium]|nr:glycosyltransferase family 2 protein [Candidatus Saccharibacteria bacterium]
MSIKVSVVVPVYNTAEYLPRCLDSLVRQSLKEIEILIIDNNSTDNSPAIIAEYQKRYPKKIRAFKCTEWGAGAARNLGIKKAQGEYVGFVDSDDYVELDAFKRAYGAASGADIVVLSGTEKLPSGKVAKFGLYGFHKDLKRDFMTSGLAPWQVMLRKDFITKNHLKFHAGIIYEDAALINTLPLYTEKIAVLKRPVYHYVYREGSVQRAKKWDKHLLDIFEALKDIQKTFQKHQAAEIYHSELEYIYALALLKNVAIFVSEFAESKKYYAEVRMLMHTLYPNWQKNPYWRKLGLRAKLTGWLAYRKCRLGIRLMEKI